MVIPTISDAISKYFFLSAVYIIYSSLFFYRWAEINGFKWFTQFPLRLAYGLTSFKSQGKTFLDKPVRIDGTGMQRNEAYVALSRATESKYVKYRHIDKEEFRVKGLTEKTKIIRGLINNRMNNRVIQQPQSQRLIVFDSGLQAVIPLYEVDGFDFYIIERLLLLSPTILVVIIPKCDQFITLLSEKLGPAKSLSNGDVIVFGSTEVSLYICVH